MQHGVIFDFNGTMLFDGPLQEKAWRTWAREHLDLELSDEDFAIVRAYLPAIGCDEATQDDNGSLPYVAPLCYCRERGAQPFFLFF